MAIIFNKLFISSFKPEIFNIFTPFFDFLSLRRPNFRFSKRRTHRFRHNMKTLLAHVALVRHLQNGGRKTREPNPAITPTTGSQVAKTEIWQWKKADEQSRYGQKKAPRRVLFSFRRGGVAKLSGAISLSVRPERTR
jgi:hypothetical protein